MKKTFFSDLQPGLKFISSFYRFFGKEFIPFLTITLLKVIKNMNFVHIFDKYAPNGNFRSAVIK